MARDLRLDAYITDILMRDLIGHDRAPSAFVVYLWLWRQTHGRGRANVGASLQDIARATGLSKSSVQNAIRRLKRRRMLTAELSSPTAAAIYRVNETWKR
ncbi:MAG: helix-turn-helix domain-containing protein [Alphaproteobacteria bacterium]|nr:helix-turn-helix domain-containing protein [Alphaproteobacteria bacterium]